MAKISELTDIALPLPDDAAFEVSWNNASWRLAVETIRAYGGQYFYAFNDSSQTNNTTSFVDVTGWTQSVIGNPFTFDGTELTLGDDGVYEVSYAVTFVQTGGNNRAAPRIQIALNGVSVPGSESRCYTRNTGTGSTDGVSNRVLINGVIGDLIKIQVRSSSASFTHRLEPNCCSWVVRKLD